jgi:hypothetical protein
MHVGFIIILLVLSHIAVFFVGANNPPKAILKKLLAKAQSKI